MRKVNDKLAKTILGKEADWEFYRPESAEYVKSAYDFLICDLNVSNVDAKTVIQNVWSAAEQEYGE